jgi:hypothetical protein
MGGGLVSGRVYVYSERVECRGMERGGMERNGTIERKR